MDPNANLHEQRELAEDIMELWDVNEAKCDPKRLAELVLALDEWLYKGGFLPKRWRSERESVM